MICTNKNTFTIINTDASDYFNINIVKYLVGPTNKRYNYFTILDELNVSYISYENVIYPVDNDIKIKISNLNEEIYVKKVPSSPTHVTIFFGYSDEVEFSP